MDIFDDDGTKKSLSTETLEGWVSDKVSSWRDHVDANYLKDWEEYNRLWRGKWSEEDKTRQSERSRLIAPALQQAVESSVAEVEEATFGRGKFFDVKDDLTDPNDEDVQFLRNKMHEDFAKQKIRKSVSECLINAAVFGTGIAEVVLQDIKEQKVGTEPVLDGALTAVGVNITDRTVVDLLPVMPKNFVIDPRATGIEDALGCATEGFVSAHQVTTLQEEGVYNKVSVGTASTDIDLEPDTTILSFESSDTVKITKYFGLVPRHLLSEEDDLEDGDSFYVEAIVVLADDDILLKAEESPYMMEDRPIIAFQWDVVPSRFWGRGVCEKGYNSQKALDAEIRARIDALALTIHPMMAIDATRIPRGSKPEVRPGKMLLTNGDPREVLHPFNFGNVSQITFAQAGELQKMVQQATGAVDTAGMPMAAAGGEATAAGISMSLGAVIKRHKRTLINFQENFLIPFVEKAAWRYMQFDPENYPVSDYKFTVTSSLGIIAREYEVGQLVQLLQTMSPDSPLYAALIESIVDNMNLSNREELIETLKKAAQPNPEAQQQAAQAHQAQMAIQEGQVNLLNSQAAESQSRANKYVVEAQMEPQNTEIKRIEAITRNLREGDDDDKEFEKRMRIADLMLKERQSDGQSKGHPSALKYNPISGQLSA